MLRTGREAFLPTQRPEASVRVFHFEESRRPIYSYARAKVQKEDSAFAGMQWAWPLEFSFTREQKEEKLASRGDRQSNFFMISSKACFLISQKLFMETWPQDGRSYLQKAGIVMELVVKYLVLKVWKLLLGIEQREYLLLVVWNQSHHQNYLQIPKIKDEQCYI